MPRKRSSGVSTTVSAAPLRIKKRTLEHQVVIDLDLAERIKALTALFSVDEASKIAGRAADSLRAYGDGLARPPFVSMANLCAAKGVSLEWLATGREPMHLADRAEPAAAPRPPEEIDELAGAVFFAVRKAYRDAATPLDDDALFHEARKAYAKATRPGLDEAHRIGAVRSYGLDLTEELMARRAAAETKRSA